MAGCHPFKEAEITSFLAQAAAQGWVSARWELEFLLRNFAQGCFVWRADGEACGYLTAIRYGRSGWIGNLLVHPAARRRGIGGRLLEQGVSALLKSGAQTVWLTASVEGIGLYQKLGFAPIDTVNRWVGQAAPQTELISEPLEIESVRAVDRVGWGDRRETLLLETCGRGRLQTSSGGFICCQQWDLGTQIGPWGCLIGAQAGGLLDRVLAGGAGHVFLDVPAGNFAARTLLTERGFTVQGSTVLMYLGENPLYQPGNIYALASMGSMG